jgi:hypothetical protein
LATPLRVHGVRDRAERRRQVEAIAERVGLGRESLARYPHEFSGGQKQRIGIARALILKPSLVVCDEPVSALDVSIQAQILNLLADLRPSDGRLSYLFISHDLGVVRYIADRVAVMYLGLIVENASHRSLWKRTLHPYTLGLIQAVPGTGGRNRTAPIAGDLPNPLDPPARAGFTRAAGLPRTFVAGRFRNSGRCCRTMKSPAISPPPDARELADAPHPSCEPVRVRERGVVGLIVTARGRRVYPIARPAFRNGCALWRPASRNPRQTPGEIRDRPAATR